MLICNAVKSAMKLLTAAAAKLRLSCPTLRDPTDGSHQALPSLGSSRQEHWSGKYCCQVNTQKYRKGSVISGKDYFQEVRVPDK